MANSFSGFTGKTPAQIKTLMNKKIKK